MRAMALAAPGSALEPVDLPSREPGPGEALIRISACGVCRTDLHIVDGELAQHRRPTIPGHEIVGRVAALGPGVAGLRIGDRVGVPWLGHTCGRCAYCLSGRENLCDKAEFTGWTRDGGFAQAVVADARFVFPLPERFSDEAAAPLLCAGLIGYRAWRAAGPVEEVRRIGIYGFGAAAHLIAQVAIARGQEVFAFTRPGDGQAQAFARALGCAWAGASDERPGAPLDAALLFAPVGALVPAALRAVAKGGTVVCAGIHMSDIPAFPYDILWGERRVVSVANLTRADGLAFLPLADELGLRPETTAYPLAEANRALGDLREGRLVGAAVLKP
ncbi:MAG: zinc-dependent alcohol dehydrogenase family protein [Alphaproteobacteria bacterium]|nr:zinc-dependent alcohol dehydrogenase family protein [Alphaproteobacteria bacterium]